MENICKQTYLIGIDTGTHTGIAVWELYSQKLLLVDTMSLTKAMEAVMAYRHWGSVFLYIEDARLRKWFGNTGRERLKGAGSVCRDASIWEDWCGEQDIPYELVAPRDNRTKLSALQFRNLTGWPARTTEHGRDAAMLVYGMSKGK